MKIVVLDGHTLNPGDLSWAALEALGDCTVHPRTPPDQVVARAQGAAAVLTNKTPLGQREIDALPDLRYLGVLATGYDVVDVAAARARGIPVTNVPEYGTRSVAQLTFAHLLELAHHVGHHAGTVRAGRWTASPDFCYWDTPLVELDGLTLGVVGLGRIGRAVASLGLAFGMRLLAADPAAASPPAGVELVPLDTLLRRSDVVTLHCPLTAQTRGLIDAARLALMKPSAFLLNTSRGPLVVAQDLADALHAGRLAGAGLDVLDGEPPSADHPLLGAPRCLVTPHLAWATGAARARLLAEAVANLRAFLAGEPRNVVNP